MNTSEDEDRELLKWFPIEFGCPIPVAKAVLRGEIIDEEIFYSCGIVIYVEISSKLCPHKIENKEVPASATGGLENVINSIIAELQVAWTLLNRNTDHFNVVYKKFGVPPDQVQFLQDMFYLSSRQISFNETPLAIKFYRGI